MNSVNDLYRGRQGASPSACPPETVRCGGCGMLECLCRPRFFAGQILSADDLNRLDAYIRAKHRLHNRQLHGWGVVNGLEATCNPCGNGVAVGCGYALGPCGEDIVVCEPVTVDICELIRRCRDAERHTQPCQPGNGHHPCNAEEEEWILAIRYAESPSRGVKPLRPSEASGSRSCGCGAGSTAGSCGCGGSCGCHGKTSSSTRPRSAPVQCEPTVVCEGFAFEVYRKPVDQSDLIKRLFNLDAAAPESPLYQRFLCCTDLLIKQMPKMPGSFSSQAVMQQPAQWSHWGRQFRAGLQRYFDSHGAYHCSLQGQLQQVVFPTDPDDNDVAGIVNGITTLTVVWLNALMECLCSALLPPCPGPAEQTGVPLAVVRVRNNPCRVIEVCNWTIHRKFTTTFPAIEYWLSILPFGNWLRQLMELLCCGDFGAFTRNPGTVDHLPDHNHDGPATNPDISSPPVGGIGDSVIKPKLATAELPDEKPYSRADQRLNPSLPNLRRLHGISELSSKALRRGSKALPFRTLFESLLAPESATTGSARLSAAEMGNLPQLLLADQFLRPLVSEMLGPMIGGLLGGGLGNVTDLVRGREDTAKPAAAELDLLKSEIAALRGRLEAQDRQIASLAQHTGNKPKAPGGKSEPKARSSRGGNKP
ncbi:hypothetical protein [Chitinimonas lacunae]|uniref:Uncharacterized protein n=1 Tax=Chitinimonas lacunae TaxID=1963018 RepID=A0ABV8MKI5_9NEIS